MSDRHLELMLTVEGGVELRLVEDESLVWSGDADEEFLEAFDGQEVFEEDDLWEVVDYLIDCRVLTQEEAGALEFSERLDTGEVPATDWDDDDAPHRQLESSEEE